MNNMEREQDKDEVDSKAESDSLPPIYLQERGVTIGNYLAADHV